MPSCETGDGTIFILDSSASSWSIFVGRHADQHFLVVVQDHRRVAASAEALAFLEGEPAVWRGTVPVDAELALQMLRRPRWRPTARTADW